MTVTMNVIDSLTTLGLTSKQAELYTFLLKQPKDARQTVFTIAKGIKMPRSTVYIILEELEGKKLVSSYKKNNVLHYFTADPIRLSRDLKEKEELLGTLLPALQKLSKDSAFTSSVQTFTGAEGVKIVFDDTFNHPEKHGVEEFHTISHPKLIEYMPKQFHKYMENKKRLNLHSKLLVPAKVCPKEYATDSHRETRLLPTPFSFEGTMIIYGRSHRDNEVYSMIIDSQAITEMLDALFLCLWSMVPKSS